MVQEEGPPHEFFVFGIQASGEVPPDPAKLEKWLSQAEGLGLNAVVKTVDIYSSESEMPLPPQTEEELKAFYATDIHQALAPFDQKGRVARCCGGLVRHGMPTVRDLYIAGTEAYKLWDNAPIMRGIIQRFTDYNSLPLREGLPTAAEIAAAYDTFEEIPMIVFGRSYGQYGSIGALLKANFSFQRFAPKQTLELVEKLRPKFKAERARIAKVQS